MRRSRLPALWFVAGFGMFMFTRRSEIVPSIPVAIIIAPIFILRFSRSQPVKRGILLTLIGFLLSMNIALWGLFEVEDPITMVVLNVTRSSLLAILYFLPYLVDGLAYPKLKNRGFISSIVFPVAVTAILFLSSLEGPFDGTVGKSQYIYGPLVVKQIASLVGLWGFVFLYSWLASVVNYAWENDFKWNETKKSLIAVLVVVCAVLSFGVLKITGGKEPETVKVAAVVLVPEDGHAVSMENIFLDKKPSEFDETIKQIEDLTSRAANNGAKIVSFQEFTIVIVESDEYRLRQTCKRISENNSVYLSITYAYFVDQGKGKNKHILIDPKGQLLADYTKRYLLGFGDYGETGVFEKGQEIIQAADTPYGKIALSTCRDMDFPSYIRQAGRMDVDIMLGPSYDWPKSTGPSYYERAIENGFSFVRPTYNGFTYAEDYNGRILASMDSDQTVDGIMYADVPTKGIKTLYAVTGDLLGWLCVLGVGVLAVTSMLSGVSASHNSHRL